MAFNSVAFLEFFSCVFFLHYALAPRWRNPLLLLASLVFYGSWNWRFVPLLLLSTWISWYSGLKISRAAAPAEKKKYVALTVVVEVSLLVVFKYFNFLAQSVTAAAHAAGLSIPDLAISIALPLGISYYTFQAIAYSVDVYRRKVPACPSLADFTLFKAFFPILMSGPIERAGNLLPQITRRRTLDWAGAGQGVALLLWGLFQKTYVSDHVAPVVNELFDASAGINGLEAWIALYAFAIQLLCDFSGYTDMARGLAKLLGFDLMLNFNLPYLSRNIVEFWRRWHISLSSWFADYVYEPVFFRYKALYLALFLTFFLNGVWHGPSWNFVLLGVYNAALVCGYVFARPLLRVLLDTRKRGWRQLVAGLSVAVTFHSVLLGFLLFRAREPGQIGSMLGHLFAGPYGWTDRAADLGAQLAFYALPLVAMQAAQALAGDLEFYLRLPRRLQFAIPVAGALLFLIVEVFTSDVGANGQNFIYFQF